MIHTLKHRLILTFLAMVSITLLSILLLYSYIHKKEKLNSQLKHAIENTNTLILKDVTVLRDFFENETINSKFFKTKESRVLKIHKNLSSQINSAIQAIDSLQSLNSFGLNVEIEELRVTYLKYNELIDEIVKEILIRGFKDDGLEGDMRDFAHKLEDYEKEIGFINILQLRRHEKDFIIRQENEYILKHTLLIKTVTKSISENSRIKKETKTEILNLIKKYQDLFINLTEHEKNIGIKNSIGLKAQIDFQVTRLENHLQNTIRKSSFLEEQASYKLKRIFLIALSLFVLFSIFAAVYISKKITSSIIDLKEKISEFVAGNFSKINLPPIKNARYEIDTLANNFSLMEQHILNQMNALRNGNEELATLIGKASKDIKKPIVDIKTIYDDTIRKHPSNSNSLHTLQQLDKSWNKILTIVDELSTVKDIKTEEILIEKIDLEPLIRSIYFEHKELPQFQSIVFSLNYSLKQEFYSSKELIRIIFSQLLENSIKYSKSRNGFSFINIKIEGQDKFMIKVTVSDNGIGIKKEDQSHIFKMFYRTTNKLDGTGLGLYLVQNSLQKINGAISLESDENTGTVFTLIIPNKKHFKESRTSIKEISHIELDPKPMVLNFI